MSFNELNSLEARRHSKTGAVARENLGVGFASCNSLNLQKKTQNVSILVNSCVIVAVL